MPRKSKDKNYFGPTEENAVRCFLTATTYEERNLIYNDFLRFPLNKMIESIIRRYKLYRRDMDYRDIHSDTLSFLITKAEKFDPEENKKAYSYFGTICKNYLMGQIMKDQRDRNRKISYEDIAPSIEEGIELSSVKFSDVYTYELDDTEVDVSMLLNLLTENIKQFMVDNKLNDNERKVGLSLVDLFENFETYFVAGEGNKFNKNVILYSLREMTGLTTKEIRLSLKRYKEIYQILSDDFRNT